jgi:hypothetical protein
MYGARPSLPRRYTWHAQGEHSVDVTAAVVRIAAFCTLFPSHSVSLLYYDSCVR